MSPIGFREHIPLEHRARIFGWLGDSSVWMRMAVELDRVSGRGRDGGDDVHAANVAHVCTGLAFELVLKALAVTEGLRIEPTHSVGVVYGRLPTETQAEIAALIHERGSDPQYVLDYLDESMCHPDRKYWMVNPQQQGGPVGFVQNIRGLVIPDLAVLHQGIAGIVARKAFKEG